jgi:hypothetical protein
MSNDWELKDIPLPDFKYSVITEPNPVTGEIKILTEIMGKIEEEIVATKADQVRNALIDLGWTPPEGKEHMPESKLPNGFDRDRYLIAAPECIFYGVRITEMPLHDLLACAAYLFGEQPHLKKYFKEGKK